MQPWQGAILLSLACIAAAAGVYLFRMRGGNGPSDMVSYLPTANATIVYIDVDAMRRSGILNMIAGSKAAEELEYRQFVDATQFDYRRDLDAAAVAFKDGQVFFALRGRFQWKNLQDYAVHQGGSCRNSFCTVNGSTPNRRLSFYPLRADVMAFASSPDDFAAYQVTRKSGKLTLDPPHQPVWVLVPALALKNAESLPAGTKAYASALQGADQIVFTIGPEADHLLLALNVTCRDVAAASALLVDFENTTNTLRKWIEREHQRPNPADLSGVLVSGSFRRQDRLVYGQWPLSRAFVDALVGGSL
ncbi:MAG TPA: hypothetical protein VGV35_13995 [Bryobacteraceae bacterium]|nr:hypothetical protein [Bryobacteraceae bacterium]